jgi:hypothetical protein
MDGTGDHHVKWNKPNSEKQVSHFLSYAESGLKEKKRHESKKGDSLVRGREWARGKRGDKKDRVIWGKYDQSTLYTWV